MVLINNHDTFVEGKYVNLREVELDDAKFILDLRCDEKKSRFLHETEYNLEKQVNYLKHYKTLDNQWYFIIENKEHKPLGTLRIYDVQGTQYTGGSWLMIEESSASEVFEGSLLMKQYAFETLGFEKDYFDVRKGNKKVIRYHKLTGAKIVGESDIDYFFEYTKTDYLENKEKLFSMIGE